MPTLILHLPPTPLASSPEYDYVLTQDGEHMDRQGRASAALLPARGGRQADVVAVVAAAALSWHRITLPARVLRRVLGARGDAQRVRGVLAGVLEEQLLDEPELLHLAVFAAVAEPGDAQPAAWVAVCERAWLHASLQALEAAGIRVGRIMAECSPSSATVVPQLQYTADAQPAQLVLCTRQGVALLPHGSASMELARSQPGLQVWAEPAVMSLAQEHWGAQVQLQTRAQRLLQAAQSPWNLAQLELGGGAGGRLHKRLLGMWQQLRHAPQWRPLRWGLLALLALQVLGLNALAWRERSLLQAQQAEQENLLRQTFPEVGLVLDAPLQMQRAVDELALQRGQHGAGDVAGMLAALQEHAPAQLQLSAIELAAGQLRLSLSPLDARQGQSLVAALQARGLAARLQDGQLLLGPRETF